MTCGKPQVRTLYCPPLNDYKTLSAGKWRQALVVQKSRFIAFATRVESSIDAQAFIKSVALPDATHHCYAYVTVDGQKSSDNGEPAGTAGLPILQAIKKAQLTDVVVVVERYFGGIKLGTGGLARAYGQVASQVLATASQLWMRDCVLLSFNSNYEQQTAVARLINEQGKQMGVEYGDLIHWRVAVPVDKKNAFLVTLAEVMRATPNVDIFKSHVWVEFNC